MLGRLGGLMSASAQAQAAMAAATANFQQALAFERRQAPRGEVYPGVFSMAEVFKANDHLYWKTAIRDAQAEQYCHRFMGCIIPVRYANRADTVDVYACVDDRTMDVKFMPVVKGVGLGERTAGGERETSGLSIEPHEESIGETAGPPQDDTRSER